MSADTKHLESRLVDWQMIAVVLAIVAGVAIGLGAVSSYNYGKAVGRLEAYELLLEYATDGEVGRVVD